MKCKKHPSYKGSSKPKVNCEGCWVFYLGMSESCVACGCEVIAGQVLKGFNVGCEGEGD